MEERAAPLSLASHRLRGEGDHEVVEGGRPPMEAGARQAGYKTHRPQGDTTTLLNPQNPGHRVAHMAAPFRLAALATHPQKGGGQVTWRRGLRP